MEKEKWEIKGNKVSKDERRDEGRLRLNLSLAKMELLGSTLSELYPMAGSWGPEKVGSVEDKYLSTQSNIDEATWEILFPRNV